jgi:hypothetical protein
LKGYWQDVGKLCLWFAIAAPAYLFANRELLAKPFWLAVGFGLLLLIALFLAGLARLLPGYKRSDEGGQ